MDTDSNMATGFEATLGRVAPSVVRVEARRRYPLSGLVWSEDGTIVTTNRAVEYEEDITLGLEGGRSVKAAFVGRDPRTDLAVLEADANGLAPAAWLEADALALGRWVLLVGRPRESLQASAGIVGELEGAWRTALGASVERRIRSDARPFPGFSGGPLVAASGEVIGLSTSALRRGAPVALPRATVDRVVAELLEHGHIRRGYLGLMGQPVRLPKSLAEELQQPYGVLLLSVEAGSPAEDAGLVVGDIVTALEEHKVLRPADLLEYLSGDSIGRSVGVRLVRGGRAQDLSITVGER